MYKQCSLKTEHVVRTENLLKHSLPVVELFGSGSPQNFRRCSYALLLCVERRVHMVSLIMNEWAKGPFRGTKLPLSASECETRSFSSIGWLVSMLSNFLTLLCKKNSAIRCLLEVVFFLNCDVHNCIAFVAASKNKSTEMDSIPKCMRIKL